MQCPFCTPTPSSAPKRPQKQNSLAGEQTHVSSPMSRQKNTQQTTPVPLEFLPEARRKAVYASFTKTPKHKKNLPSPSKKLRDQHKESDYLKIIQRYGSGDVQHAQSHDLKHLKDWVETLETHGIDVGLASATPHYYQSQGKITNNLWRSFCFNSTLRING